VSVTTHSPDPCRRCASSRLGWRAPRPSFFEQTAPRFPPATPRTLTASDRARGTRESCVCQATNRVPALRPDGGRLAVDSMVVGALRPAGRARARGLRPDVIASGPRGRLGFGNSIPSTGLTFEISLRRWARWRGRTICTDPEHHLPLPLRLLPAGRLRRRLRRWRGIRCPPHFSLTSSDGPWFFDAAGAEGIRCGEYRGGRCTAGWRELMASVRIPLSGFDAPG